METFCNS